MQADTGVLDEADLRERVRKALGVFLDRRCADLESIDPRLSSVGAAITTLLAGGKRLRPAFAYWGWRGAGGDDVDEIVRAAAALELVQASALVHDDVMDDSDTRRGSPAVHRVFAAEHARSGWRGDARRFGDGVAILLGDLCLSWADELLLGSGLPQSALVRAKPQYDDMRTEVMAGQFLDLFEQAQAGGTVAGALTVARWKSASYTVARPLLLGGALAGATDALLAGYDGYGVPLGTAFQLRDDVLGVYGDPSVTGKPAGDDLREGKRTVLVAEARARTDDEGRAVLDAALGDPGLTEADVERVRALLSECGALGAVEDRILALHRQALAALDAHPPREPARSVLTRLAHVATTRTR